LTLYRTFVNIRDEFWRHFANIYWSSFIERHWKLLWMLLTTIQRMKERDSRLYWYQPLRVDTFYLWR